MFKMTFNQKVALGFVVILVLLTTSGVNSLWNLNDISNANTQVSETSVPVVQVANQAQIELLKLANLGSLAYNARDESEIKPFQQDFNTAAALFSTSLARLQELTERSSEMKVQVLQVKENYEAYSASMKAMFDAKLAVLDAKSKADAEADTVIGMADDVGQSFADIMNFTAPAEHAKAHFEASGFCNQADMYMQPVAKTVEEVKRAGAAEEIETVTQDISDIIYNAMLAFDTGAQIFAPMDTEGYVDNTRDLVQKLQDRLAIQPNLVDLKLIHLNEVRMAQEKFDAAKTSVSLSVKGLDEILAKAGTEFGVLQKVLSDNVSFGFKSTIGLLIVLLSLATQNFYSMRNAIRKKMIDLAKLNQIGGRLAAARDQNTALDEVLNTMSEKTGVAQGSVYLFNRDHELEAKAFLPPMANSGEHKPIKFTLGEGVMGRAAEMKSPLYVHDTSKDKHYVAGENESARSLLSIPLVDNEILMGVMNFSGEVDKVHFADSDYEFVSTVAQSLVTTLKNIRMVEVIEEHNRDLEKKVQERTVALKQKNHDIANMLSNMQQGLFTIVEGGLVHPEYAAYLETIFETPRIANRNFADLLFTGSNLSQDAIDSAMTAVSAIVGEDAMMYEFNSHLLVSELSLTLADDNVKLLELDWSPIVDDNEVVSKLMVTVRDVTALKALQAEAEAQKIELEIIGEILSVDQQKFEEFIDGSRSFIDKCHSIITETQEKDLGCIGELFRNMHTVKGNARTYGFKPITEVVHIVENTYDQLRKNDEMEWQPAKLLSELENARTTVERYEEIARAKLGRDGGAPVSGGRLDEGQILQLLERVTALAGNACRDNVVSLVNDARRLQQMMQGKSLQQVLDGVLRSVDSLAQELGKETPKVVIDDAGYLMCDEAGGLLNNVFMHVLRNAMDHGIERADERAQKGKSPQGNISILCHPQLNGAAQLVVQDDGRGMAIGRIYRKAQENGLLAADQPRPPAAEIANLIFASGFSTAETVTEVSGRGVGMDAVRQFLQNAGGNIEVVLSPGDEVADFRAFSIVISLPSSMVLAPVFLAKAS